MSLGVSANTNESRFKKWLFSKKLSDPNQVMKHLYSIPRFMKIEFDFIHLSPSLMKNKVREVISSPEFRSMPTLEQFAIIDALRLYEKFCSEEGSELESRYDSAKRGTLSADSLSTAECREKMVSQSLETLLQEDKYRPLLDAFKIDGITTLEQIRNISILQYMNRKNIYPLKERLEILNSIKKRFPNEPSSKEVQFILAPKDAFVQKNAGLVVMDLASEEILSEVAPVRSVVSNRSFPVESWSDVLLCVCSAAIQKSPERIGKLADTPIVRGECPLISRNKNAFRFSKEFADGFFVNADPDVRNVVRSAQSICLHTGIPIQEVQIYVRPKFSLGMRTCSSNSEVSLSRNRDDILNDTTASYHLSEHILDFIKGYGVQGASLQEICSNLQCTRAVASELIASEILIVEIGREKYVHRSAIVDADKIADGLHRILERLFERFDGYVSARLLYNAVRVELMIPLNDNGFDDIVSVYLLAKHFFSKEQYRGHSFVFSNGTHIWYKEPSYPKTMKGLAIHFARMAKNIVSGEECDEFLKRLGFNVPNFKQTVMGIGREGTFLQYDRNHYLLDEFLQINEQWIKHISGCLSRIFDGNKFIILRDIRKEWYSSLPELPFRLEWTALLLQEVLRFHQDIGYRSIPALSGQRTDTLHAALVPLQSEIATFADVVSALLQERREPRKRVSAEDLRQFLKQNGVLEGNELVGSMHKALDDFRFAWSNDRRTVLLNAGV